MNNRRLPNYGFPYFKPTPTPATLRHPRQVEQKLSHPSHVAGQKAKKLLEELGLEPKVLSVTKSEDQLPFQEKKTLLRKDLYQLLEREPLTIPGLMRELSKLGHGCSGSRSLTCARGKQVLWTGLSEELFACLSDLTLIGQIELKECSREFFSESDLRDTPKLDRNLQIAWIPMVVELVK